MSAKPEILYEPMIFFGPGSCPLCGGPLVIVDSEMTVLELLPDGTPISEETVLRVKGACKDCGNRLPMMRWQGQYIPYSESSRIIKILEMQDRINDRLANQRTTNDKNPLAIED